DEGVAALQPADQPARPGAIDEHPVDLILVHLMMAAPFARIDELGIMLHVIEYLGVDMEIVDDHVGFLEAPKPLQREEPDISGTGPHKIDFSLFHRGSGPTLAQKGASFKAARLRRSQEVRKS